MQGICWRLYGRYFNGFKALMLNQIRSGISITSFWVGLVIKSVLKLIQNTQR